jgi:hypothetical protein
MELNNTNTTTNTSVWSKPELTVISVNNATLGGPGDVSDGGGGSKAS